MNKLLEGDDVSHKPLITEQQVEDLLVTALEGGSNYWYFLPDISMCEKPEYERAETKAMSARIYRAVMAGEEVPVQELDTKEPLGFITKKNIVRAEALMWNHHKEQFCNIIRDDADAVTADVWFQLVVMGRLIFG